MFCNALPLIVERFVVEGFVFVDGFVDSVPSLLVVGVGARACALSGRFAV